MIKKSTGVKVKAKVVKAKVKPKAVKKQGKINKETLLKKQITVVDWINLSISYNHPSCTNVIIAPTIESFIVKKYISLRVRKCSLEELKQFSPENKTLDNLSWPKGVKLKKCKTKRSMIYDPCIFGEAPLDMQLLEKVNPLIDSVFIDVIYMENYTVIVFNYPSGEDSDYIFCAGIVTIAA